MMDFVLFVQSDMVHERVIKQEEGQKLAKVRGILSVLLS